MREDRDAEVAERDPYDLSSLALTDEDAAARYAKAAELEQQGVKVETPASERRREQRKAGFVMVPLVWVDALAKPKSRATWTVAHYILHRAWRYKGAPVVLSNVVLADLEISRVEKLRALAELEALRARHCRAGGSESSARHPPQYPTWEGDPLTPGGRQSVSPMKQPCSP